MSANTIESLKCEICHKGLSTKYTLSKHDSKVIHSNSVSPFNCEICPKGFSHKGTLERHRILHNKNNPFKCQMCQKPFTDNQKLKRHQFTHNDSEAPYKCETCNKGFGQKGRLEQHRITHSKDKLSKCEICHDEFVHKGNLERHRDVHHSREYKLFKGEIFRKEFVHEGNLERHQFVHNNSILFNCGACHKGFAEKEHLERHKCTHNGLKSLFRCELCHEMFSLKQSLQLHARQCVDKQTQVLLGIPCKIFIIECFENVFETQKKREHENIYEAVKSHICERCGTSYKKINDLKDHQRIHPDCHLHRCQECNLFVPEEFLIVHMKLIHNKVKNDFECDVCHMTNLTKEAFISHRATHSGEVEAYIKRELTTPERKKTTLLGEFFIEPVVKSEVS